MKNKYKFAQKFIKLLFFIYISTFLKVSAQLNPLNSQYFLNQYQANPAYAGFKDGFNINLDYRKQWGNMPGSPNIQSITADYKLNKVGIGINFFNEKSGSLQRTKTVVTYAYHLQLNNENQQLNFGSSIGILNERLNYSEVNGDLTDLSIVGFNHKRSLFDGDFGIAYTSNRLNIETAVPNLINFINQEDNKVIDRARFFAAASYKISTGNGENAIEFKPKIAFRDIQGYKSIFDAGANFTFANKLFMMGMYHSTNSASFGAGINYKNALVIMGFYTTETAALRGSPTGTFEISLSATMFK